MQNLEFVLCRVFVGGKPRGDGIADEGKALPKQGRAGRNYNPATHTGHSQATQISLFTKISYNLLTAFWHAKHIQFASRVDPTFLVRYG